MNDQALSSDSPIVKLLTQGLIPTRPPIWLMRQAGRYLPEYRKIRSDVPDFLTLCYSPDLAAEVTLQPMRRFGLDAAIVFADILLIPDGLGQQVSYLEGSGPRLEPMIRSQRDIEQLNSARVLDHVTPVFETLKRVRAQLAPEKALIGFAGAPWTVAVYMVEGGSSTQFMATRRWAAAQPKEFAVLIELLTDATIAYLDQQIEAGADIVQIFDTWSGLLPPPAFRRWCVEPVAEIVARFKDRHPNVPVIGFPRGAGSMLVDYATATGVNGVSLDATVSANWAAENVGNDVVLQGNLDPSILVAGGTALEREAVRLLHEFEALPHIFNLGHGIVPETPPENVARLCELVTSWKRSAS